MDGGTREVLVYLFLKECFEKVDCDKQTGDTKSVNNYPACC